MIDFGKDLENFCSEYLNFMNRIFSQLDGGTLKTPENIKKGLFKKNIPYEEIDVPNALLILYKGITNNLDLSTDIYNTWQYPKNVIKPFAEFLLKSAPYFLYTSDGVSVKVYGECNDYTNRIDIEENNLAVSYEFTETNINVPKVGIDDPTNPLSFMSTRSNVDDESKVLLVTITIGTSDGKDITQYKFINTSPVPINNELEVQLFESAIATTRKVLFDTFIDIVDNYVYQLSNLRLQGEFVSVKEIMKNAKYKIWRR